MILLITKCCPYLCVQCITELDHGLSEIQIKCIAKQMFEVCTSGFTKCLLYLVADEYFVLGSQILA